MPPGKRRNSDDDDADTCSFRGDSPEPLIDELARAHEEEKKRRALANKPTKPISQPSTPARASDPIKRVSASKSDPPPQKDSPAAVTEVTDPVTGQSIFSNIRFPHLPFYSAAEAAKLAPAEPPAEPEAAPASPEEPEAVYAPPPGAPPKSKAEELDADIKRNFWRLKEEEALAEHHRRRQEKQKAEEERLAEHNRRKEEKERARRAQAASGKGLRGYLSGFNLRETQREQEVEDLPGGPSTVSPAPPPSVHSAPAPSPPSSPPAASMRTNRSKTVRTRQFFHRLKLKLARLFRRRSSTTIPEPPTTPPAEKLEEVDSEPGEAVKQHGDAHLAEGDDEVTGGKAKNANNNSGMDGLCDTPSTTRTASLVRHRRLSNPGCPLTAAAAMGLSRVATPYPTPFGTPCGTRYATPYPTTPPVSGTTARSTRYSTPSSTKPFGGWSSPSPPPWMAATTTTPPPRRAASCGHADRIDAPWRGFAPCLLSPTERRLSQRSTGGSSSTTTTSNVSRSSSGRSYTYNLRNDSAIRIAGAQQSLPPLLTFPVASSHGTWPPSSCLALPAGPPCSRPGTPAGHIREIGWVSVPALARVQELYE
ncbi:hypothetical protein GGR56DRAFT_672517 [Xylariaceae sp. FL0804]|nr:hypothetical protein GGR56DRAFT_672517 [Xylariaceae sp. FL0804]